MSVTTYLREGLSRRSRPAKEDLSRRSQQAKADSGGQATKRNNELSQLKRVVYKEQLATLRVIDKLVELEKSQAYLKHSSSLYKYLTVQLKYSEGAAMRRLNAARVIGRFPEVREVLRCREVSLCTLSLVASESKKADGKALIEEIRGKSKREVEALLAFRKRDEGKAPMKEHVRVIAPRSTATSLSQGAAATAPLDSGWQASSGTAAPLDRFSMEQKVTETPPPAYATACHAEANRRRRAPAGKPAEEKRCTLENPLYRLSFTATNEMYELYQDVLNGMSHKLDGASDRVAQVFEAGLLLLKKEIGKKRSTKSGDEKKVTAATKRDSRYISASLKRTVFENGKCQCQYKLEDGSVCGSKFQLELDHITPFSLGGETTEENLRVLCRKHNQFVAKEAGLIR